MSGRAITITVIGIYSECSCTECFDKISSSSRSVWYIPAGTNLLHLLFYGIQKVWPIYGWYTDTYRETRCHKDSLTFYQVPVGRMCDSWTRFTLIANVWGNCGVQGLWYHIVGDSRTWNDFLSKQFSLPTPITLGMVPALVSVPIYREEAIRTSGNLPKPLALSK